ncbi:hypothetical protein ACFE04_018445 [Oxalis oulophora]
MRGSIANLKENLNRIALDVHDDEDDELEIYGYTNGDNSDTVSDRTNSHAFAHSKSVSRIRSPPIANGIDTYNNNNNNNSAEIDQYKAEIKRLQESETEIKALSVNYAALLKEKEDQLSRLHQENGSLKQNLDLTKAAFSAAKNANGDLSPNRQKKTLGKNRTAGNQMQHGVFSRQNSMGNGYMHAEGKDKELADLLEEKSKSLAAAQASHELQIKQLQVDLVKERANSSNVQLKLQEEVKLNQTFQDELKLLKSENQKASLEINKVCNELNEKISEIKSLQTRLSKHEGELASDNSGIRKKALATLQKENAILKMEKDKLEASLEISMKASADKTTPNIPNNLNGMVDSSGNFPEKEEMDQMLQKLEKDLKEMQRERDKARREVARLKQHLLDKESEESTKMDEDSKIIEELKQKNEYLRTQIIQLEKALNQAMAIQEEAKMMSNNEIVKCKEVIDDLNKKLRNCMNTIDAKNLELLNLQTALGQYYAEIEAKEYLERDLAVAREESAKISGLLNEAAQHAEVLKREKDDILGKLSQAERTQAEGKSRALKLEEDNAKLRRALEQSMTRLNRMSVDSDFLVDRRIVIKLLVTYFQRNHSKEKLVPPIKFSSLELSLYDQVQVLELMVRMLGFSEEDKQRIGVAQQGGRGVVRGVLGLPGRFVGGILGGNSTDSRSNAASDNQSFADLWVDFLLKENEEREKREAAQDPDRRNASGAAAAAAASPPPSDHRTSVDTNYSLQRSSIYPSQTISSVPSRGSLQHYEHSDSEFSTVPLTSSDSSSRLSRLLPQY